MKIAVPCNHGCKYTGTADKSVDVYFGHKALVGKQANWAPTNTKCGFEVMTRFYGPEKEFFDKTWKMGNVEETK